MPQMASRRPFLKIDLRDQQRLDPLRRGFRSGLLCEWARALYQAGQELVQFGDFLSRESKFHLAGKSPFSIAFDANKA
jgi:hypothetical protein